jgi:peptide deformylase
MSEVITIDTGLGIVKEEKVELLPVFSDNLPMLSEPIPEYVHALPNPQMTKLVQQLKLTMKEYSGLGLAANQCGIFQRVFVIGTDQFQIACINPKIISSSAEVEKTPEGCLSFPALTLKIERPKSIDVEFTTENGEVKQMKMDGLTARCFQHELDHLNGIKFTNHVGETTMLLARQRQAKMMKKFRKYEKNK